MLLNDYMAIFGSLLKTLPPIPPKGNEYLIREVSGVEKIPLQDFYNSELMVVVLTFICTSKQTQET